MGGWPLAHDKLFREVFQWFEPAKAFSRLVLPESIRTRLDIDGLAEVKVKGKAETVLTVLRARFRQVPERVENAIRQVTDPIALDSWAEHAASYQSQEEFEKALGYNRSYRNTGSIVARLASLGGAATSRSSATFWPVVKKRKGKASSLKNGYRLPSPTASSSFVSVRPLTPSG